jgi:predicted DNA-binding WGR domain protein
MLVNIYLEARSPANGCDRAYHITMERDLFGAFLVETRYGRIGARGHTLARSFADEAVARGFIDQCLRRRQSAPRRIGVEYIAQQQI